MTHVRIIRRRSGRRLNDASGQSETLCGAAPTSMDLTVADAREDYRTERWAFLTCEKCRALVEKDEADHIRAMAFTK